MRNALEDRNRELRALSADIETMRSNMLRMEKREGLLYSDTQWWKLLMVLACLMALVSVNSGKFQLPWHADHATNTTDSYQEHSRLILSP